MLALVVLQGVLGSSPGDPITKGCKSISAMAQDAWCIKNCAVGNCPPTICECTTGDEQPAVPPAVGGVQAPAPEPVGVQAPAPEPVGVQAPAPEPLGVQAPAPESVGVQEPAPAPLTAEEIEAANGALPTASSPAPILVTPKEEAEADATEVKPRAPRKSVNGIAPVISGPWFYCADGVGHERSGKQRSPAFGTNTSRKLPDWLASSNRSGNSISLAFMNPRELLRTPDHGVPAAFVVRKI